MSRSAAMRAAVLGSPIAHSKSPQLHLAAYGHLGLRISYTRCEVDEPRLDQFLLSARKESHWLGWSVTMPLKAALVPHMSAVSQRVKTLGVLNTVIHTATDKGPQLHGENTDVDGIVQALAEAGIARAVTSRAETNRAGASRAATSHVQTSDVFALLGAGGTAAAALAAAAELGFTTARIYARSAARAAALEPIAESLGLTVLLCPIDILHQDLVAGRIPRALVSTLPPRAADAIASGLAALPTGLPRRAVLLDVAYDPWPSALSSGWEKAGGVVVSGLQMLLHQAVKQVELFTQNTPHPASALKARSHAQMVEKMRAALGDHTIGKPSPIVNSSPVGHRDL